MPDYADLSIELERAYGRSWRVGDIIQGTVYIYGRDGKLTDSSKTVELSGTVYEQKKDWWSFDGGDESDWDSTGISVVFGEVDVGEHIFAFAPTKERVYRLDIQVDGDIYARTESTISVEPALSDNPEIPNVTISGLLSAPTLTFATASGRSETSAKISVETDTGNGTLYWIVTEDATGPTKTQIIDGQTATGSAAEESGSVSVTSTGSVSINVSNLSKDAVYTAFFLQESADGLLSNIEAAHFVTEGTTTVSEDGELLYSKNTISTTIF